MAKVNFNNYAWTVILKGKARQKAKDSFEKILKSSKKVPNLSETDGGRKSCKLRFKQFLGNEIKLKETVDTHQKGQYLQKILKKNIKNLSETPKKVVFEQNATWIDELELLISKNTFTKHSTFRKTETQAYLKKIEKFVYDNTFDERKLL